MGASFTQHPELFRAVVSQVGIYDVVRTELDPNGVFNTLDSRVTSSLSFFEVLALLEMVGHPPLGEPIKLASCVWE